MPPAEPPRRGPRRPPRPAEAPAAGPRRPPRPASAAGPRRPAPTPPGPAARRPAGSPARPARPSGARPAGRPAVASSSPTATVRGLAEVGREDRRAARRREVQRNRLVAGGVLVVVLALVAGYCTRGGDGGDPTETAGTKTSTTTAEQQEQADAAIDQGLAPEPPAPYDGWVDPKSSGEPWSTKVVGQLTFRGNPTRSYYGLGPMPKDPEVLWRLPESGGWCSSSPVGGKPHSWCGSGWTGEPSVWEQGDATWVSLGAYDQNIHFLDGATGEQLLGNFDIGDIVKGSVTRDPDGFPLLYSGSRADFHILATDRPDGEPADLWSMGADNVSPVNGWNDDWDSSPLVIDDYLFEGGENGQWYIIKLNRGKGADGLVTVDPEIVFHAPGWDEQLTADLAGSGSRAKDTSIENSLAISGNTVYFTNSGGLLQGWDISHLKDDPASVKRTFRFWTGDDSDASVVVDKEGFLYVAQERERSSTFATSDDHGQLMKIDPRKPDDPIVWSVHDPESGAPGGDCEEANCYGIWATPAIANGVVYVGTNHGRILAVSQKTGELIWEKKLPGPTWQSPVVVDDVLLQGDCSGVLHAYDVSKPTVDPPELWSVQLEGCIESTPAVFKGKIYVGARGGAFYALGDA